jgi:MFS family permease
MVAAIAIAPLYLTQHGPRLDFVGVVVSIHVLCMFAPSPLTGWLADSAGRALVAGLGAAVPLCLGRSS